jgi:UDP-N-acetylglucosamine 2-epimerase (non-hydrolysing)
MKIINVCGARPNFMKIASVMRAYETVGGFTPLLVHTGQHYDARMSRSFFDELEIPRPDINLEVGSGSHAVQTAAVMERFEPVVLEHRPDAVLVVGDVNSTIACGLVAAKLGVPVVHVEAGLRSFDRSMPEEINRVLTDAISDVLFVSEPSGLENLRMENVADDKVHFVGNVMIDTLLQHRERADASSVLQDHDLTPGDYVVITLHRPSNVDDVATFTRLAGVIDEIQRELPVIFPMHPRTRNKLGELGLDKRFADMRRLRLLEPLGYLDFLKLTAEAGVMVTDSGGIQEETTILGVPCLTVRENTERPVTITAGTNQLVGTDPAAILAGYRNARARNRGNVEIPEKWDGQAGQRIATILRDWSPTR